MTLNSSIPRSTSSPFYQSNMVPTTVNQDISHSQATAARAAKKAAIFGLLSVCPNRRLPSRVSRRSCAVNIKSSVCGGDRTRDPWSFNPRLRSSQAHVEHLSRSRARSTRIPTGASCVIPQPTDCQEPVGLPSIYTVLQCLSSPLAAMAPSSRPSPVVSTLPRPSLSKSRRPSIMARARRAPSSSRYPPIHVNSSASEYTFDISLPTAIKPEMVTITTAKGNKLKIVADAWHLEADCHFEWEIAFPSRDVDNTRIRAKFEKGRLTVRAGRHAFKK